MSAVSPAAAPVSQQAAVEAALVLLERMGLSPADLVAAPQSRAVVPTFAVRLLTQATTSQAHRVTSGSEPLDPASLATINATDIPEHLPPQGAPAHDQFPGQYL